jgi:AraC-like DNA-binding protein
LDKPGIITFELPPVPYYITTGFSVFSPGEEHPNRHNIGIFDLLWVVKGALYIGEEDSQWEITEGQTLLLLPNRHHYSHLPCKVETHFYWNHFEYQGVWCHKLISDETIRPSYPVRHAWANPYTIHIPQYAAPPEFTIAERLLRKLITLSGQQRSTTFWQEQQAFIELLHLLEEGELGAGSSPALHLAERTEAYLRQHFQSNITNESLAEALRYHPNYISRCMKEIFHCTPLEYLHEYRLEQAKQLLIKTNWSISQIAEHIGFQYTPYFSNCFKEYAGMSPLRFRKQYLP